MARSVTTRESMERSWCSPSALRRESTKHKETSKDGSSSTEETTSPKSNNSESKNEKDKNNDESNKPKKKGEKKSWSSLPNVLDKKQQDMDRRSSLPDLEKEKDMRNVEQDLQKLLQELRQSRKRQEGEEGE